MITIKAKVTCDHKEPFPCHHETDIVLELQIKRVTTMPHPNIEINEQVSTFEVRSHDSDGGPWFLSEDKHLCPDHAPMRRPR